MEPYACLLLPQMSAIWGFSCGSQKSFLEITWRILFKGWFWVISRLERCPGICICKFPGEADLLVCESFWTVRLWVFSFASSLLKCLSIFFHSASFKLQMVFVKADTEFMSSNLRDGVLWLAGQITSIFHHQKNKCL